MTQAEQIVKWLWGEFSIAFEGGRMNDATLIYSIIRMIEDGAYTSMGR